MATVPSLDCIIALILAMTRTTAIVTMHPGLRPSEHGRIPDAGLFRYHQGTRYVSSEAWKQAEAWLGQ
jgi:hypothetical protein